VIEHEDTASLLDCYSPWTLGGSSDVATSEGGAYYTGDVSEEELSGGYNEGVAGDDLPLFKHDVKYSKQHRYSADSITRQYPGLSEHST